MKVRALPVVAFVALSLWALTGGMKQMQVSAQSGAADNLVAEQLLAEDASFVAMIEPAAGE